MRDIVAILLIKFPYSLHLIDWQEKWMYCDEISQDYAFAQSVLFKVYGSTVQETGHKTKGVSVRSERYTVTLYCYFQ